MKYFIKIAHLYQILYKPSARKTHFLTGLIQGTTFKQDKHAIKVKNVYI